MKPILQWFRGAKSNRRSFVFGLGFAPASSSDLTRHRVIRAAFACSLAMISLHGFGQTDNMDADRGPDTQFADLSRRFTDDHLAWNPAEGTGLGLHQYDGKISIPTKRSIARELAHLKKYQTAFDRFSITGLSPQNKVDLRICRNTVATEIFDFEELSPATKNPILYPRLLDVSIYIKRAFAPLPDRVRSMIAIERRAPEVFAAARANLETSLARPFVEVAMEVTTGSVEFLEKEVVEAVSPIKTNDPALYAKFLKVNQAAANELRAYAEWLKQNRLPMANASFALGRDRYARLLHASEMIDVTPEDLLALGLRELKLEQAVFADAARAIDPNRPAIEVFRDIQKDHPSAESLLPETRKDLEAIRSFLVDHHIITLPSDVRVRVEETPTFNRASSFASMSTPGPFEKKANEAYYYVTPTEKEWTEKQKDEWLTAFNYYTTDVVSIHEAYPGHYVQFLHLNASHASKLEKIFTSYAFEEGWAHYAEKMMLDEGFGGDGSPVRAAKYRLAQSDEALLRLCRLCVSIKMHCQGMTVEEGARFFRENCYYEAKPSYQEAIRGTFDPGYLLYTVGKLEILKLRSDWRRQEGSAYSLERFHEELLAHGAPPIRLLREIMLNDASTWDQIL